MRGSIFVFSFFLPSRKPRCCCIARLLVGSFHWKQVVKSVGLALAWYLGSSAVAFAVATASGIPVQAHAQKKMPIGATLFVLYVFSTKKARKRNR